MYNLQIKKGAPEKGWTGPGDMGKEQRKNREFVNGVLLLLQPSRDIQNGQCRSCTVSSN